MHKLIIYLLFFLSPAMLSAMRLYICATGSDNFARSCKKCKENGYCKSHPYNYSILKKIENPNDDLKLQNLVSILCNYKEVSKVSRAFFEDFSLILIYCDDSDAVQFVAEISFMHRGEIIIKNPKRWQKNSNESNCFVQPLLGNNDYTDIPNFDDNIYFYIKDDIGYKNFIKSILNQIAKDPIIMKDFEHKNRSYSILPSEIRARDLNYFDENYVYWKSLIPQDATKTNNSNKTQ